MTEKHPLEKAKDELDAFLQEHEITEPSMTPDEAMNRGKQILRKANFIGEFGEPEKKEGE